MLPVLALMRLFAQPPVSQSYRDDSVASGALARTMASRGGQAAQSCQRQA